MSLRLYWAQNDGMSGHVFLGPSDVELLRQEMVLQGVTLPPLEPGVHISATEVAAALASASPDPMILGERKLWADWLQFLAGASANGGLLVR